MSSRPSPGEDPEGWLASLDRLGWSFGLERIRLVCELLGKPQHRFASIHVVGSNGKSSVATATAALLGEAGFESAAYLSPHLDRWAERVQVGGAEISPNAFGESVARTAAAVEAAERSLEAGERVTQFEAATAAAFDAFARARVEVGVIEAGLGGRLDATNVIPSRVTALASVSLEHTDLLGESVEEIAAEKLAVLRHHSNLVLGPVPDAVERLAERTAGERSARLVRVGREGRAPESLPPGYPRLNFAVALAAAEAFLGRPPTAAEAERAAASARLPGRLERVGDDPPVLFDAAHNPAGSEALAASIPDLAAGRPVVAVLAALADKPAAGICGPIAALVEEVVCTEIPAGALEGAGRPGARSHPASSLAEACAGARQGSSPEVVPDPAAALEIARARARELGGLVLVAGSFYLVAPLRAIVRRGAG